MAERRSKKTKGAGKFKSDAQFEEFLQLRFAEVRAELDKFDRPAASKAEGQLLQLPQARAASDSTFWKKLDSWRYAVAATVLLAVAVPAVMQLNREQRVAAVAAVIPEGQTKTESTDEAPSSTRSARLKQSEREEADFDAPRDRTTKEFPQKKIAKTTETGTKDRGLNKKEDVADVMSAREAPADLKAMAPAPAEAKGRAMPDEAAGAPAPESAKAPAASPAAPAPYAAESSADEERTASTVAKRSAPIADAQFKQKHEQIAEEEKLEMERLWKEFEKDPKSFNQDKKRAARLKALLARHDTRSRAKKVRAAERQYAY